MKKYTEIATFILCLILMVIFFFKQAYHDAKIKEMVYQNDLLNNRLNQVEDNQYFIEYYLNKNENEIKTEYEELSKMYKPKTRKNENTPQ